MVRIKNRYIIAQLLWNTGSKDKFNEIGMKEMQVVLREKFIELFGDVGFGEFGNATTIKYFEMEHSKILVVKTTREGEHDVRFALSCMNKVKDIDICIRSLSIKSCPRTCMNALKEYLQLYFDSASGKISSSESKLQSIFTSLELVEL